MWLQSVQSLCDWTWNIPASVRLKSAHSLCDWTWNIPESVWLESVQSLHDSTASPSHWHGTTYRLRLCTYMNSMVVDIHTNRNRAYPFTSATQIQPLLAISTHTKLRVASEIKWWGLGISSSLEENMDRNNSIRSHVLYRTRKGQSTYFIGEKIFSLKKVEARTTSHICDRLEWEVDL